MTIYLARVLGSAAFGVIGFATAVTLYLRRLADGGLELGVGVQLVAEDPSRVEDAAPSLLAARLLVATGLLVAVSTVGFLFMSPAEGGVLAGYGLTLLGVAASTRWIHYGLERTGVVAASRISGELLYLGLVLLMVHGPGDLVSVPLAQAAGDAAAAVLLLVALRRWGYSLNAPIRLEHVRKVFRRARPLVTASLLALLIYNSDLILLRFFRDVSTVGLYAASYTVISFLGNLSTAYGTSLLPTLTRLHGEDTGERDELYASATVQAFAVALPVTAGGAILAAPIVLTMFGEEYRNAVLPLQILLWTVVLGVIRDVGQTGLMSRGREDLVLRMNGVGTAVNLGLNFLLIPWFGMAGAAASAVLTELCRSSLVRRFAVEVGFRSVSPSRFWRPAVGTVAMATVITISGIRVPWLAIPLGAAAYGGALVVLGGLRIRRGGAPHLDL